MNSGSIGNTQDPQAAAQGAGRGGLAIESQGRDSKNRERHRTGRRSRQVRERSWRSVRSFRKEGGKGVSPPPS